MSRSEPRATGVLRRLSPLLLVLLFVRCGDGEKTCRYALDCAEDEYCDGGSDGCGSHTGVCRSLETNEGCADWGGSGCEAGLVCHSAYDPPECRAPSPLGGPCGYDQDCDPEADLVVDADDPICDGADRWAEVLGVCVAVGSTPTGGACGTWRACAAPEGCWGGVCRGPGTEGETCTRDSTPDDRPPCAAGLYCDSAGHDCRRWLAEGEHCFSYDDRCAAGLFCYSQEAVCHRPLAEGDRCVSGDVCAAGLFCSSRSTCLPPLALGERCWETDRCADGLFCYAREAVCHEPLGEGEPCDPGRDVCAPPLGCDRTDEVCRAAS